MSSVTCPQGHQSNDPEWCDVCGTRLTAPGAPSATAEPASLDPVAAEPVAAEPAADLSLAPCPHCGVPNPPDNLFCEGCGYDFTTGQTPPDPDGGTAAALSTPPGEAEDGLASASSVNWVVIVSVAPEWYAIKGALAEAPCPPVTTSTIPIGGHAALIGRTSQSRGVRPEIALDADTGVSRRHAQFVRDGDNVSIVDLSSTNGTYVVYDGEQPDDDAPAIQPGVAVAIDDGDSVYVGAWTKLTIRKA
ncbi:MAG TPA: FHA domain-containing protein [Ilumatobacteraceae bacterium]|nr:FHA domain-containing protein [Ilumatobacteraceae bacterium]